jgi:hypothetical protein
VCVAIGEFNAGSRDEVANRLRNDDFAWARLRCDASADCDRKTGDLAVMDLAFPPGDPSSFADGCFGARAAEEPANGGERRVERLPGISRYMDRALFFNGRVDPQHAASLDVRAS